MEDGWPPGRPRVLVTDAWLANAGDAAISLGVDAILRRISPSASVLHASYQYRELGPRLTDLRLVAPLEDLIGTPWSRPAPGWAGLGDEVVNGADLVICQPGGALVEAYRPDARITAWADVADRGIPMVFLGLTISPFVRAAFRQRLGRVFRHAHLVTVRDALSRAIASDLGSAEVVLGTDPALALFEGPPAPTERSGISVVLTEHHPLAARQADMRRAARRILDEVLRLVPGEEIHVWSTVQGLPVAAREDDADLSRQLLLEVDRRPADVHAESGYVDPRQAIQRVAQSRSLVTMRMHPGLFAACTGTPFGLVLDGQRTGVFGDTGLKPRIANPFDTGAVSRVVGLAVDPSDDGAGLWSSMEPLRIRLADTVDRLEAVLREMSPVSGPRKVGIVTNPTL